LFRALADRAYPTLLVLLLIALTTSITAIDTLAAVLVVAGLARLGDPARRARHRFPLAAPFAAFAIVTLVSAALADEPVGALWQARHLAAILLFFVAVNGFRDGAQIHRALAWFFAAVAFVSVYAMAQVWACGSSAPLPQWVAWALRVKLEACRATWPIRGKGFFSIYMTLAGTLSTAIALLAATLLGASRHRRWLVAPTLLAVIGLGLTLVRGAWLGCAVAIGLLASLTRRLGPVLLVAAAVLVALAAYAPVQKRLLAALDPQDASATERLYFWYAGARMVEQSPVLGLGPGGVRRHYPAFKHPAGMRPRTGHLHNNLVQVAAERGLLGLAAWLWIWVAFYRRAARIYRELPPARGDDRALVAGSLAAVTGFLVAGLFEYNFGDSEVIDLIWVVMAFPFVVDSVADEGAHPLATREA